MSNILSRPTSGSPMQFVLLDPITEQISFPLPILAQLTSRRWLSAPSASYQFCFLRTKHHVCQPFPDLEVFGHETHLSSMTQDG